MWLLVSQEIHRLKLAALLEKKNFKLRQTFLTTDNEVLASLLCHKSKVDCDIMVARVVGVECCCWWIIEGDELSDSDLVKDTLKSYNPLSMPHLSRVFLWPDP